jgi:hypothetical protein
VLGGSAPTVQEITTMTAIWTLPKTDDRSTSAREQAGSSPFLWFVSRCARVLRIIRK